MTTARRPGRSRTETQQGETQETVPRMPHERDESADSQAREPAPVDAIGRIAHEDQARGLADTSRAAESDAAYHGLRKAPAEKPLSASRPSGRRASRR